MEIMHKVRDGKAPLLEATASLLFGAGRIVRRALFADRSLRFLQSAAEPSPVPSRSSRAATGGPLTVEALKPLLGE